MNAPERFLAACTRRAVDRTPVWIMRQAGRYLPEYRAVRERVDFLTLCKSPDLATEVSLQPIDRFGMDACVIFSDILIPVEAMGAPVAFGDAGPYIAAPVKTMADVNRLNVPDPIATMPFVMEALRRTREELRDRAALVGFVGGPFTLASYMIEGGASRTFAATKALIYSEPATMHALLAKISDTIAAFAAAQVLEGAQAVQVFDTWAGELSPEAYEQFALPYQTAIVSRIARAGVPVILYVNGCAGKLDLLARTGADVLSVDWRVSLREVRDRLGDGIAVQGNVDPGVLLSTPAAVTNAALEAMRAAGPVGHILNLGHGILPGTPIECASAFVEAAKAALVR
jgi:uroporphyrinogen decarboxylase